MDVPRRIARSRFVITAVVSTILGGFSGCTEWMGDYSPSEIWNRIGPSQETLDKLSPSNILYNMSPTRLSKLNEGPGMNSDAYYSVSDPLTLPNPSASDSKPTAVVQPVPDSETNPFSNENGSMAGNR